jgi:hypothetical protein
MWETVKIDTPLLTSGRCSGYVCPNGLRSRLNGLPGRTFLSTESQAVAGSVLIAMQTRPAVRAFVPAAGQALVLEHAAARTGLAGGGRRHCNTCLPSLSRCARPDAQEGAPPSVGDGLRQVVVLEQVGRLHVFIGDRGVLTRV